MIKDAGQCPITNAMSMVGGKWKPVIIYVLSSGRMRFGKIAFQIPIISRKVLTQQLRELESDGIITRTVYPEIPPRVEYELTQKGKELMPVYNMLAEWSKKYTCQDA